MPDIAILIKSLYRDRALLNCIDSIKSYIGNITYRFYIADDGPISETKGKLFDELKHNGHVVLELPHNTGASKSRNLLIKHLDDERYVLRLDDDFAFCENTNIYAMKTILENIPDLGVIADLEKQIGVSKSKDRVHNKIRDSQGYYEFKHGTLILHIVPLKKFTYSNVSGFRYAYCDYTRNMLLIKREVLNDVHWDETFTYYHEHPDFMLQIKKSKWNLAFTTDSMHLHREDLNDVNLEYGDIQNKRKRISKDNTTQLFLNKYNINERVTKRPFGQRYRRKINKLIAKFID